MYVCMCGRSYVPFSRQPSGHCADRSERGRDQRSENEIRIAHQAIRRCAELLRVIYTYIHTQTVLSGVILRIYHLNSIFIFMFINMYACKKVGSIIFIEHLLSQLVYSM